MLVHVIKHRLWLLLPTGVYKIRQALIAQAVGADYVAPYLGRIADGIRQTYSAQPLGTFDDMSEEEYMAGTAPWK
jgi:transaldolase